LENLLITHTPKTPEIDFNHETGLLQISGVSVPENAIEFYQPILQWLRDYAKNPQDQTIVTFKLTYLNTSSLQYLYDILVELSRVTVPPYKVIINWYHLPDDLDMKETGEDFKDAVDFDFNILTF